MYVDFKVYKVKTADGEELGVVARVAKPSFPKDKLESEVRPSSNFEGMYLNVTPTKVATMKYISEKTFIPIPKVISWNSDATNEVGAEYMFITKVSLRLCNS